MQLHKSVMTFTASSPPAFRSSMGIPSHPADFRLDIMSERLFHFCLHHLRFILIYVFVEGVRCVWVPSVQFFRVLLPYFFHLLPFRYHPPRAQFHGCTTCTLGSCHIFDFSVQVPRSSHFIVFFNLSTFLLQVLYPSCLALLWKAAFSLLYYLSSPLLRTSLRSSAIFTASSDSHFVTFFLLAFGTLLSAVSFTMSRISLHGSSGSVSAS